MHGPYAWIYLRTKSCNVVRLFFVFCFFLATKAILRHTRLIIVDTTSKGNQPLINDDNDTIIVANAEIYNHEEIVTYFFLNAFFCLYICPNGLGN